MGKQLPLAVIYADLVLIGNQSANDVKRDRYIRQNLDLSQTSIKIRKLVLNILSSYSSDINFLARQ